MFSSSLSRRVRPASSRPSLLARLIGLDALHRERHSLRHLDDHLLRDIGIDASSARAESARPLWDVPDHFRR